MGDQAGQACGSAEIKKEPSTVERMKVCSLKWWCVADIVQERGRDEQVRVWTGQRMRQALGLGAGLQGMCEADGQIGQNSFYQLPRPPRPPERVALGWHRRRLSCDGGRSAAMAAHTKQVSLWLAPAASSDVDDSDWIRGSPLLSADAS